MANARVDWGEFEYDGQNLLYSGHARMPPEQLPSFLLTADGDDRPHVWWLAQTKLYDLRTSPNPSVREMRDLLAQAIRHNRLVVPDILREAEHNAAELIRLYAMRDVFARRHRDPPPPTVSTAHPTPVVSPTTPSRTSSPRPNQSSPGAMSLHNMVAHQTLMSLPLAAPVPVPGPTPHPLPLFTLLPHGRTHGGIPVPAPGPNPPPLVPAYAQYTQYTTRPAPATTPPQQVAPPMDEDPEPGSPAEVDELADEDKSGPATATTTDAQPDRPKKRSRPTRAHPSSPRVCTTCSRTDSPEWRRGPHGPKTLCNACGLKWAKQSGSGRRRGGGAQTNPGGSEWRGEAYSSNVHSPASRPGTADPFQGPSSAPPLTATASLPPALAAAPLPPALASSLPSNLGTNAPITSVPPNPRSPVGSHSPDVKVETDPPNGLMDLATVAALESGRNEPRSAVDPPRTGDEPQPPTSLKRPRADSSYNGIGRAYDRPPSSRTPSSTRGYPESYTGNYDGKAYAESGNSSSRAPYSDSSRAYSSGSEGGPGGGVRPINVIPIGTYRD
ncbi:unnamed protein product [Rhizoctonia solani]|uniref:GATA-type domain-containing protein n=1 Tax=Rhizoctonia solani TaxID=456999 RepID=A0A8H2WUC0_9AGAM|nr:unnamed protein product [Rhizoctonia solani]